MLVFNFTKIREEEGFVVRVIYYFLSRIFSSRIPFIIFIITDYVILLDNVHNRKLIKNVSLFRGIEINCCRKLQSAILRQHLYS